MEPPIILKDADGHLGVFDSKEHAEVSLDPDDIEDNEFTAFDGAGRLLRFEIIRHDRTTSSGSQKWRDIRPPVIFWLTNVDEKPDHAQELRAALIHALELSGLAPETVRDMALSDLVQLAVKRRKGTGVP